MMSERNFEYMEKAGPHPYEPLHIPAPGPPGRDPRERRREVDIDGNETVIVIGGDDEKEDDDSRVQIIDMK